MRLLNVATVGMVSSGLKRLPPRRYGEVGVCKMFARIALGAVTAAAMVAPALAGMMTADEARRFVAGKVFAFTCFDGTRGAGRILDDMGAAGSIQFSGAGPVRHIRLPGNTLQVRGQSVCASIKGVLCAGQPNADSMNSRVMRSGVARSRSW